MSKLIQSIIAFNLQEDENIVHGNRPGDIAARQKRTAETLPEKFGIAVGRELRAGDIVPCREGDIVVGICKVGQSEKEVAIQKELEIIQQAVQAKVAEIREHNQNLIKQSASHQSKEEGPTPAPQ